MNNGDIILDTLFKFDPDQYSKIDIINYQKNFNKDNLTEEKDSIRVNSFSSESTMIEQTKEIIKSDFHKDSFFHTVLVAKRMMFLNLFQKKKNLIETESDKEFISDNYLLKTHKVYQFRGLLLVIKSFLIFLSKMRDIGAALDSFKIFYTLENLDRETKTIFKYLQKLFQVPQNYLNGKILFII